MLKRIRNSFMTVVGFYENLLVDIPEYMGDDMGFNILGVWLARLLGGVCAIFALPAMALIFLFHLVFMKSED